MPRKLGYQCGSYDDHRHVKHKDQQLTVNPTMSLILVTLLLSGPVDWGGAYDSQWESPLHNAESLYNYVKMQLSMLFCLHVRYREEDRVDG